MLILTRTGHDGVAPRGVLRLTYEWRQKSRCRVTVAEGALAGDEVGLQLPRGTVLRDGDVVTAEDGTCLAVQAAIEQLLHLTAADSTTFARIAYHLGNRHVPVQIGRDADGDWLRLQLDHVLEHMAEGLGARITVVSAAFDPESGAYGAHAGHAHGDDASVDTGRHDDRRHAPRIHDFTGDAG